MKEHTPESKHRTLSTVALTSSTYPTKAYTYSLQLDRLELTLKPTEGKERIQLNNYINTLPEQEQFIRASDTITLTRITYKVEKNYYHSFQVYFCGEAFAELHSGYRLQQVGREYTKIKFLNPVFYRDHQPEVFWYSAYLNLIRALHLQLNNIKYLEIALDSNQSFVAQYGLMYNYSALNIHQLKEDHKFKSVIKSRVATANNGQTLYIGNPDLKQIVIYPKSAEVEKKHKQYIFAHWERMGVSPDNTERIEVRLKDKLKKMEIRLQDLTNTDYLLTLYKEEIGNNLTFKDLRSRYFDQNRNAKYDYISVLDLDRLQPVKPIKLSEKKPTTAITQQEHTKVRNSIKTLVMAYILTGKKDLYQIIQLLATEAGFPDLQQKVTYYATNFQPEKINGQTIKRIETLKDIDYLQVDEVLTNDFTPTGDPVLDQILASREHYSKTSQLANQLANL